MQKFCIRETEYKIPKIDCIKLQSQSKLLGHFCDFSSPQYWCTRFGDWIAINNIGRERGSTGREKNGFALSVPTIFVWDCGCDKDTVLFFKIKWQAIYGNNAFQSPEQNYSISKNNKPTTLIVSGVKTTSVKLKTKTKTDPATRVAMYE